MIKKWWLILFVLTLTSCSASHLNQNTNLSGQQDAVECYVERYTLYQDCWAEYPQINGMSDIEKQARINDSLKNMVVEAYCNAENLQRYESIPDVDKENQVKFSFTIACEIKSCTEKYVSMIFTYSLGWDRIMSYGEPTFNYDLTKEGPIDVTEVYKITPEFVAKCMSRQYALSIDSQMANATEEFYAEYVACWQDGGAFEQCLYFTDNALGVHMWELATMDDIFWTFEIPYQDIEQWKR